jgi:RNA recognition motif-containing protein
MKLFVAGLPYDLFDDELVEIFEKYGAINSAKVAIDKETGKSRGFAFVEMADDEGGRQAIEHLNDISLGKKPLVVKQADERNAPPSNPRHNDAPQHRGSFDKGNNNNKRRRLY